MSEELVAILIALAWVSGAAFGYVMWGERTRFWAAFVTGLSLGIVRVKP